MQIIESNVIYENPMPQLRARNSTFPFLCQLDNGDILASHQMGQAFESVDGTTFLSLGLNLGRPMINPGRSFL